MEKQCLQIKWTDKIEIRCCKSFIRFINALAQFQRAAFWPKRAYTIYFDLYLSQSLLLSNDNGIKAFAIMMKCNNTFVTYMYRRMQTDIVVASFLIACSVYLCRFFFSLSGYLSPSLCLFSFNLSIKSIGVYNVHFELMRALKPCVKYVGLFIFQKPTTMCTKL